MFTENLSTLKIHKLTQEQYERELAAGNIDPNALYLTPEEEVVTSVNGQTGDVIIDIPSIEGLATETYVDTKIAAIPTELPPVTSSDKGKFLRVSADGAWEAQTVLNAEEVAF